MLRCLIVEDEPELLLTLSAALRHRGFLIVESMSASEAIPLIPHVDAVITDGLDGQCWPILLRAKELGKRVLLYTADDWLAEMARAEGFVALVKMAGLGEVLAALNPVEVLK